jgi:predicted signal transduction protein with EAL and GGDEF domain
LRVIAFRLSSFVRETDTPARLGGDEFAVLFEGFENADQLVAMASRLLNVIIEPVNFSGRDIVVGASIGIAISDGAQDPEALLRNADVAMYHAKWGGKNRVQMFEEHMSTAAVDRLEIKADLAHMLDRDELHAYYQPIVRLRDRHVHGFESLARWIHPRRGLVPPDSFIPMTETSGLIVPLGNAILQKSLEQLVLWQRESTDQLSLSVNMSPRQLLESGFVGHVENLLDTFEIDPRWLTMELTESEVLTDSVARRRLTDLGKLGVGIAADDFGSGFASYASLVDLPFTTLKIDRTMLMQIDREPQRTEMQLRSILDMAATLGLKVIAEGVETSAQEDLLLALGCDFAQGYFFGRPAPAASWRVTGAVEGS